MFKNNLSIIEFNIDNKSFKNSKNLLIKPYVHLFNNTFSNNKAENGSILYINEI